MLVGIMLGRLGVSGIPSFTEFTSHKRDLTPSKSTRILNHRPLPVCIARRTSNPESKVTQNLNHRLLPVCITRLYVLAGLTPGRSCSVACRKKGCPGHPTLGQMLCSEFLRSELGVRTLSPEICELPSA